ncbi:MAG: glutamine-hydrolyzing carbamoyl-phosphate synthase small subunit [archaeon]
MNRVDGKLVLEDGTVFSGFSFGHPSSRAGEVVFNTGLVGYPQTLTDPSYRGQILALTYPLVGNYGIPKTKGGLKDHFESGAIHVSGLIIQDYSDRHSHHEAVRSLGDWLREHRIPALWGIDTRALTKKLRERGVMLGKIVIGDDIELYDPNTANLVAEVSPRQQHTYKAGPTRVVLVDCGAKNNIIREFLSRGITVIRVPFDHPFADIEADGIMVSNGPGDPKMCTGTIENLRKAMEKGTPIMGICLGNQLLALAAGADTYKLKYGHRGQNQPCLIKGTMRCFITSQNHGFAVDAKTLPKGWEEWFVNNNDGTNEGIRHKTRPFASVQFHPEAAPGPVDTSFLFDDFLKTIAETKRGDRR